ncbi:hypothetical protein D3C80_1783490 [compost metagenome]
MDDARPGPGAHRGRPGADEEPVQQPGLQEQIHLRRAELLEGRKPADLGQSRDERGDPGRLQGVHVRRDRPGRLQAVAGGRA